MQRLHQQVESKKGTKKKLDAQVETLQQDVATLTGRKEMLTTQIEDLQKATEEEKIRYLNLKADSENSAARLPESEENAQSMYSVTAIPCRKFREEHCIWAKRMTFLTCNLFAYNTVHGLKIPHTYGTMILERYLCKQFDKP